MTLPKALHPPKLQHILVSRQHNLVKAQPRDDDTMKAPADFDDTDYDYGGSNYSALKPESVVPDLSDEELDELDGGEVFAN